MLIRLTSFLISLLIMQTGIAQKALQQLTAVSYSKVIIDDKFWTPRIDKVATNTLRACIEYTENKTGRIRNFKKAARAKGEQHEGVYYDDSDVYKAIEAMAYSLKNHPDSAIEEKADEWIDNIAAAQLPDGYLNTYYTLTGLDKRWTDMEKHEDYCAGHLIEAAIAYVNTTGKNTLLNVAIRLADHIDSTFRLQDRHWVSGHQEIELALMKIYHYTNNERYLKLAQWYIAQRGHGYGKGVIWDEWKDPKYCQDDIPVKDQTEITGHAVRAMYMYSGTADIAAATADSGYMHAMNSIWNDVVFRNMYITGGIGSLAQNEGFGEDYYLPNENAYCETCASVGMVFWNHRMNLLTADTKFVDVMERSLYNGALDGLSLSGDRFFYGNPLASIGNNNRKEWFGTACCPSNIARLVASLGDYIYATSENKVWVNLYVGSKTSLVLNRTDLTIEQETNYPWQGDIKFQIDPAATKKFSLCLRIPGWLSRPVPGDLYHYKNDSIYQPIIMVNEKPVNFIMQSGYAVINRLWKKNDVVRLQFPMAVRKVISRNEVKENKDKIALQYGPLVYCVEGKDNNGKVLNLIMPQDQQFTTAFKSDMLGGINTIKFNALAADVSEDGSVVRTVNKEVTAIPYYSWCNRGPGEMLVWLPTKFKDVKVNR